VLPQGSRSTDVENSPALQDLRQTLFCGLSVLRACDLVLCPDTTKDSTGLPCSPVFTNQGSSHPWVSEASFQEMREAFHLMTRY